MFLVRLGGFIAVAQGFLKIDASEEAFDPQTQLKRLIEKTQELRSEFEQKSLNIDSLLERVVKQPSHSSLVELKSEATVESEVKAFEKRRAALLQKDNKDVTEKQREFNQAMQKLKRDTNALLRPKSSSFLELRNKYADGHLNDYFEDSQHIVQSLHDSAGALKEKTQAMLADIHRQLLEHQHHAVAEEQSNSENET
jgi:hypothetical protein